MSKKDVEKYFDDVAKQYIEMTQTLKDIDEAIQQNLLDPDRLDEIKKSIEPLKTNYMTLSWVMFLLNKPVNKKKHKRYEQSQIKNAKNIDPNFSRTPNEVKNENDIVLDKLHVTLYNLREDN